MLKKLFTYTEAVSKIWRLGTTSTLHDGHLVSYHNIKS